MSEQQLNLNQSHSKFSASESQEQQKQSNDVSRLNTIIQKNFEKKEQLGVHFSGIIQNASLKKAISLNVLYVIQAGSEWEVLQGQTTGISQRAGCQQNRTVWIFPFNVTYRTRTLLNWPQIYVVLYRTDYFGRSIPEAYGNLYLPRSGGINKRKIQLYKPIQPKSIWSCLNFCTASFFEIKEPEKNLNIDKNRAALTVEYFGQMNIEVQVTKMNFQKHGYE